MKYEDDVSVAQRKSERFVKVNQEPTPSPKKRVKQTTSGPRKRRNTLKINYSNESKEETKEKPIE